MQPSSPLRRIRHLRGKLFVGTTKVDYANPNMILHYPYIWSETLILERYIETIHNLLPLSLRDIPFRENIIMLNLTFRCIMCLTLEIVSRVNGTGSENFKLFDISTSYRNSNHEIKQLIFNEISFNFFYRCFIRDQFQRDPS